MIECALESIEDAGDISLGQWIEEFTAVHVRRRLSMREQIESGLTMIDIRGTPEAKIRASKIVRVVPRIRLMAEAEIMGMP
jgi:hypothetical protein